MARGPRLDPEAVLAAHAGGELPGEIAVQLGVKSPAITRLLGRHGVALPRRYPPRTKLARPTSEARLRELALAIDGTWFPPGHRPPAPEAFENRACGRCGVRGPKHREHGCRRFV